MPVKVADLYADFRIRDSSAKDKAAIDRNLKGFGRGLGIGGIAGYAAIGIIAGKLIKSVGESMMIVSPAARAASDELSGTFTNVMDNLAAHVAPVAADAMKGLTESLVAALPAIIAVGDAINEYWETGKSLVTLVGTAAGAVGEKLGKLTGFESLEEQSRYLKEGGAKNLQELAKPTAPVKPITPAESAAMREKGSKGGKGGLQFTAIQDAQKAMMKLEMEQQSQKKIEQTTEQMVDEQKRTNQLLEKAFVMGP